MIVCVYTEQIFSAQHGSWNRGVPIGARLMITSLKPDGTGGKAEVFAEGGLNEKGRLWQTSLLRRPASRRLAPRAELNPQAGTTDAG